MEQVHKKYLLPIVEIKDDKETYDKIQKNKNG